MQFGSVPISFGSRLGVKLRLKQGCSFVSVSAMDRGVLCYEFEMGVGSVEIFS